jgi:hypothetical protein
MEESEAEAILESSVREKKTPHTVISSEARPRDTLLIGAT